MTTRTALETSNQQTADERQLLLSDAEADRRWLLLAELRAALAERGVRAVVAGRRRLKVESATGSCRGSGRTDPELYIDAPDRTTVRATTDGTVYELDDGEAYPAADPALAAAAICGRHAAFIA